jgi:16S rRNA (cytidine1402-2'-O)-methyltransferase
MGSLVLVPTPVGNLEDITLRAIGILKEADFILAEDTRTTGFLLHHLGISKPLKPFHLNNEHHQLKAIVAQIKSANLVALVSDAGTPSISDPGYLLVKRCIDEKILVTCLPGPTAIIPALAMSGFPTERFCFEGFLPHKKGRLARLQQLEEEERTIVFYESPHRISKTLAQMIPIFGKERKAALVREISKMFEECVRATLEELLQKYSEHAPKGELVLIIAGKGTNAENVNVSDEAPQTPEELFLFGPRKKK